MNNNNNTNSKSIIQKSNKESFFVNFHQRSVYSDNLFKEIPIYNNQEVIVLQIMLAHEGWILAEVLPKDKL